MAYEINSKATLASLHTAIGQTHLSSALSVMNFPPMSRACFKIRERETGKAVERVAHSTCEEVMLQEKNHAATGQQPDENNLVPMSCSYNMGWQKQGKCFNSNTGEGAVMGLPTGKILNYATKNKTCRTCEYIRRMKKKPPIHDCKKITQVMEPISAVELFNNASKHGIKYSTYTGDDDSTTECYIHQQVPYGVEKFSDIHIKRSLTTRLYNLSKAVKFINCSPLSSKVIEYLVKCFSIAINQNKGDSKSMQSSLKCIVPHAFGDHSCCNGSWCAWKSNPANYKHTSLPYGKDLHGQPLKSALLLTLKICLLSITTTL